MFTVTLRFRPLDEYDTQPFHRTFETKEDALKYGRSSACMSGINTVYVYDDQRAVASYGRITNYWYEFKDDAGNPVISDDFFSALRKKVERRAITDDFNIRIRHQGLHWKVLAGEYSIPIEKEMLPWVSDAVEETERKMWEREEDGKGKISDKARLNMFGEYLIKRIKDSLSRNPEIYSDLRKLSIFKA